MPNDYFTPTAITGHSTARSSEVNALMEGVAAGFDLLPAILALIQGRVTFCTDTGVANAYVVSLDKPLASYTNGTWISFVALNTNDAAATINVNGLGVKQIRDFGGNVLTGGEVIAGVLTIIWYDAVNGYFRIAVPLVDVGTVTVNNNVKVSSADTTPSTLNTKITVSGALVKSITSPSGDERLNIDFTADEGQAAFIAGVYAL